MGKSASSLIKTVIAWIILVAVAILAFKIIIAAIAGLLQVLFAIVLIGVVLYAVVWAMKHL
jgi:hypothetical protein